MSAGLLSPHTSIYMNKHMNKHIHTHTKAERDGTKRDRGDNGSEGGEGENWIKQESKIKKRNLNKIGRRDDKWKVSSWKEG